jgi:tyrosinase
MVPNGLPWPRWLVCLLLVVLFAWPAGARADCLCGGDCHCGVDCHCNLPLDPPPQDPKANTIRKNQRDLTDEERDAFVAALLQLKKKFRLGRTVNIYDEYFYLHMMAMDRGQSHEGAAFLPWHRKFLRNFELELQAINPAVTIPYWRFALDNQPDASIWADNFMGGDGDPDDAGIVKHGPFRQGNWVVVANGPELTRNFGLSTDHLPTPQDVEAAFLIEQYDSAPFNANSDPARSLRNYLEGWNSPSGDSEMHNRVHEWIGGSMLVASTDDPLFWLVHAEIDRLWAIWQNWHGYDYPVAGAPFGHNLLDPMYPWRTTPQDVLDHHKLGYAYDDESGNP